MSFLQEAFFKKIKELELEGKACVLAVSGGCDSMTLLDLARGVSADLRLRLIVAHVHHHLRGEEADGDEAFARGESAARGLDYRRLDVRPKPGANEDELRRLRYGALDALMDETGARRCLLGHTADDQLETVLMRLSEGAGPLGLAGIPEANGRYARPLLGFFKSELKAYALERGLNWREDAMNDDMRYRRCRARKIAVPAFAEAFGDSALRGALQSAKLCREAYESLRLAVNAGRFKKAEGRYDATEIAKYPDALKAAAVKLLIEDYLGGKAPRGVLINRALDAINSRYPQACVEMGGGLYACRDYGDLAFTRETPRWTPRTFEPFRISGFGEYVFAAGTLVIRPYEGFCPKGAFAALVPLSLHPFPWLARPRKPGDKIRPGGAGFHKSLKELLIEKKIPRPARELVPVIECGGEIILALPAARGCAKSEENAALVVFAALINFGSII